MRIIGGEAKGRRLHIPVKIVVRPTAERVKEAFYDIIGPVAGKTFLDLFAGSGNMGIEALSRGALRAVFVENNRILADTINRNLETCGLAGRGEVRASDFIWAIHRLIERSETFDILFADPPYEQSFVSPTLMHLQNGSLMNKDALITLQHSVREAAAVDEAGHLVRTAQKRYGDTVLSFFKKRD